MHFQGCDSGALPLMNSFVMARMYERIHERISALAQFMVNSCVVIFRHNALSEHLQVLGS